MLYIYWRSIWSMCYLLKIVHYLKLVYYQLRIKQCHNIILSTEDSIVPKKLGVLSSLWMTLDFAFFPPIKFYFILFFFQCFYFMVIFCFIFMFYGFFSYKDSERVTLAVFILFQVYEWSCTKIKISCNIQNTPKKLSFPTTCRGWIVYVPWKNNIHFYFVMASCF